MNDRPSSKLETRRVLLVLISQWMFSLPVTCWHKHPTKVSRVARPCSCLPPQLHLEIPFPCSRCSSFKDLFPSGGLASSCSRTFGSALLPQSRFLPFLNISLHMSLLEEAFPLTSVLRYRVPVNAYCALYFSEYMQIRKGERRKGRGFGNNHFDHP